MYRAVVSIRKKAGVLDAEGDAIGHALGSLGFPAVVDVRVGRTISLSIEALDQGAAEQKVRAMCDQLLANPVIESYGLVIKEISA